MVRTMEWAARQSHLGGVPRKLVFMAVGAFARVASSLLNSTSVHNSETLIRLVRDRPKGKPLITVSNHMSTLDDPLMWGFEGFPVTDAKLARWVLAAEDICFKNAVLSYFFRVGNDIYLNSRGFIANDANWKFLSTRKSSPTSLMAVNSKRLNCTGKCIPITRGAGIYQEHMNEALDCLSKGYWLHTFPEGKVCQGNGPIRRLKWGTASLIARASVTPIVLPIVHSGFEKVMPEKSFLGRRPPFPLCKKEIRIIVGEPIEFDLPRLKEAAKSVSAESTSPSLGWPTCPHGLNEAAQRHLYSNISHRIWIAMEDLRSFGASLMKVKGTIN